MVEIIDIPAMSAAAITDEDLLLVYYRSADRTFSIRRADFLSGVARVDGTDFVSMSAEDATFTEASVGVLRFASGLGIADVGRAAVAIPVVAGGATGSVVVSVPNAQLGMAVSIAPFAATPAGIIPRGHVSGAGSVTVTFTNATSTASIASSVDMAFILIQPAVV